MKDEWEYLIDKETWVKAHRVIHETETKFSIVYLYLLDGWVNLVRIDNYPHKGRKGMHIHRYDESRVEFREMTFAEAEETIIKIGNYIKEELKNGTYRNC